MREKSLEAVSRICCKKGLYPIISYFPPYQDIFFQSTTLCLRLSVSQPQVLSTILRLETLLLVQFPCYLRNCLRRYLFTTEGIYYLPYLSTTAFCGAFSTREYLSNTCVRSRNFLSCNFKSSKVLCFVLADLFLYPFL